MENKFNLLAFLSPEEKERDSVEVVRPKTSYERDFEVSPIFQFSNSSTITAGSDTVFDFATLKPSSAKYLPFNTLQVLNNSTVTIIVYPNQKRDRPIYIPANTILSFDQTTIPALSSLVLKNNDGSTSITSDQIQILVSKDNVNTDKLAKNLHKLLLKGGY